MNKFRFLDWRAYGESKEVLTLVLKAVKKIPAQYKFELGNQIIRSSFSIILNIAEGSGKSSDKELNRFIDIALGSLYETLAGLDVLLYNKFISESEFETIRNKLCSVSNQLGGFKKRLQI